MMMLWSLFLSESFMYLLLAFVYWWITWHIPLLIPFSAINNISVSVNSSNFPFFILKLLAMLVLVQKVNEQGKFHIFKEKLIWKFPSTTTRSNILLWPYNSLYLPRIFISKSFQILLTCPESASVISCNCRLL